MAILAAWMPLVKWGILALTILIPVLGWNHANGELDSQRALLEQSVKDRAIAEHDRDGATAANHGLSQQIASQNGAMSSLAASCEAKSKAPQKAARAVMAVPVLVSAGHGAAAMNAWLREQFSNAP